MKTFDKSSKLDHVAYDIRGPVLDEANRMIAKGEKILRLNTGNPAEFGFTAPDEVIRDLIMNVRNSEGYSDSKGIFSARKAIMQYCQLKGFPNVDIDDIKKIDSLIASGIEGFRNKTLNITPGGGGKYGEISFDKKIKERKVAKRTTLDNF